MKDNLVYAYDQLMETRKWIKEIPFIQFPKEWLIQIIPPFSGATIRFRISTTKMENKYISVYLDCYENLGYFGEPHWEIYPCSNQDTERFKMNDVKSLLKELKKTVKFLENKNDTF